MGETQRNLRRRGTLLDLPHDIIQDILLLLSVKSLLRLKCVSKSLCSLISSESFVKAHLLKSSKDASFVQLKIVTSDVCKPQTGHPLQSCYLSKSFTLLDLERAMRRSPWSTCLLSEALTNSLERVSTTVRSCNGLVCDFSISGKDFTLRNPSTRRYKKLPPVDFGKGIYRSAASSGFGYVESSDDYKVFALSLQRKVNGVYHCMVKIYSLKTDSWRIVDDNYKLKTPMDLTARYLCGMLYWLRMFESGKKRVSWEVISFDLEKEAFGITVDQPGELGDLLYKPHLGVFKGHLCVLCIYCVTRSMDIWVLKEQSWTQLAIYPDARSGWQYNRFGVGTDGMIFRRYEAETAFSYYLPDDMCRRSLTIVDLDIFDRVCVHVESLVSLGISEEAGVSGSIIDFEMDGDGDDDDN